MLPWKSSNLYLWTVRIWYSAVCGMILPFGIIAFVLLTISLFRIKKVPVTLHIFRHNSAQIKVIKEKLSPIQFCLYYAFWQWHISCHGYCVDNSNHGNSYWIRIILRVVIPYCLHLYFSFIYRKSWKFHLFVNFLKDFERK